MWYPSHRADPPAVAVADRHYSRQKPGTPQFVPPGSCLVFATETYDAVWVTSWPQAAYVKHAWAGAWINSFFRNEGGDLSSALITDAVAATLSQWPDPPPLGIVTFIDPKKVRSTNPGYCYRMAGWTRLKERTKGGHIVYQLLPADMPQPSPPCRRHSHPLPVRPVNAVTQQNGPGRDKGSIMTRDSGGGGGGTSPSSETLVVTIPRTPPSELLPNAARRTDYRRKAALSRPLREIAKWTAREAKAGLGQFDFDVVFTGPVKLAVRVFWERGRNRPDVSGLGHAVKAMEDGLTDAGIWHDDKQVIEACYAQDRDPEGRGYTEFTISAAP